MVLNSRRRVLLTLLMVVAVVTMMQSLDTAIIYIKTEPDERAEGIGDQLNHQILDVDVLLEANQLDQLSDGSGDKKEILPKSQYVLILSSLPRSGSTLLGELLNTQDDSVLFFEPLWLKQKTSCETDAACIQQFIRDIYSCQYSDDFEKWLRSKQLFLGYYNVDTKACVSKSKVEKKTCIPELKLRKYCLQSRVRLMKVIRASLSWLEEILADSSIDFKIIHLIRDPRASLLSISRFKTWDKSPEHRCSQLLTDMNAYDHLVHTYPQKLMRVTLEELSLEPWDVTHSIFKFLFDQDELPDMTKWFLKTHMNSTGSKHSMNTVRDSKREFEAWRHKITSNFLKEVEHEPSCREIILKLGHTLFGSLKRVLNKNIPLIL